MRILYDLIVSPLELITEIIFESMYRLWGNVILALFFLSIFVSVLTLPLYMNANRIEKDDKERQQVVNKWTKHIRKSFTGDERMMILDYYRRISGQTLTAGLRGIVPLLLQIPLFLAAYNYLSSSGALSSEVVPVIGSLGQPDEIIKIGGFSIHILPVIMTVINCVSGACYTRGKKIGDKLQVYLTAAVFLVLLYPTPAGMVIYWICNNLFSLGRNIVMELSDKAKKRAAVIPVIGAAVLMLWAFTSGKLLGYVFTGEYIKAVCMVIISGLFLIPYIKINCKAKNTETSAGQPEYVQMLVPAMLISIVMGAVVPLKLIAASPLEFVNVFEYVSPFQNVIKCLAVAIGAFVVWGSIVWLLLDNKGKRVVAAFMEVAAVTVLVDYFLFGAVEGRVNASLVFDDVPQYVLLWRVVNLALVIILGVVVILIRAEKIKRSLYGIALCALIIVSTFDIAGIQKELKTLPGQEGNGEALGILPLYRNGRNVIVLMLDRAISAYIPFIFEEKPELKQAFDGFTWYPNTVSHGGYTIFGMPSLFGGYEYTPKAMNEKKDKSIAEDLDEALKVMPINFGEAGWDVTVCDPPYAGFSEISDTSIYDDMPYVKAYRLWGRYSAGNGDIEKTNQITKRNFVYYSLMEVLPQSLRKYLYDGGSYLYRGQAGKVNGAFLDSYREMDNLPEMMSVCDEGNSFIMMANNITHSPQLLKKPEYEPTEEDIENAGIHMAGSLTLDTSMHLGEEHYDVNMAAFIKLAEWFDVMRKEGVYDNSRIILVADHGYQLGQFEEFIINDELDVQGFNPLLMIKDFNAKGFEVSNEFMTNADTPALAMEGALNDPINPFSNTGIDMSGKCPGVYITLSDKLSLGQNTGCTMATDGSSWYFVNENIFEKDNWKRQDVR